MEAPPDQPIVQAGAIPYRRRGGAVEVLIVTDRTGRWWIVPKGNIDAGCTPAQAAAQEAWEEAGVTGRTGAAPMGSFRYEKNGNQYRVDLFLLEVTHEAATWPESSRRRRRWVAASTAAEEVSEAGLGACLKTVPGLVERGETGA